MPRHESEYAHVGTVAEVTDRVRLPGGGRAVALDGLHRGVDRRRRTPTPRGRLRVEVEERPDENPPPVQTRELEREYRAVVEEILELRGDDERIARVPALDHRARRARRHRARYAPDLTLRAARRAARDASTSSSASSSRSRSSASGSPSCRCARRIRDDVESGAQKQQREYFLRKQMDSIRKELGEDEGSVVDEYRTKIDEAGMPDDVREQAERELRPPREDGRRERRGVDDPHLPRLAASPCRGRSAPTSGSTRSTRARCSTPTTPASTT